jgi:hypothetical protein
MFRAMVPLPYEKTCWIDSPSSPRRPLPSCSELRLSQNRQYVRFSVKHDLGEWEQIVRREEQVKVFQCFGLKDPSLV